MIKNIIFDIGNVLADFRYNAYMDELGFSEEVADAFRKRVIENPLWDALDLGKEFEEEIIRRMYAAVPEYEKECDAFFQNILGIVETYPYTMEWIQSLKAAGYRIYILSNYPESMFKLHDREKFEFTKIADGVVVSAFEKMSKPDPEIYKLLLNRYGLKAEECLFIDDRKVNVDAAVNLGIKAFVFEGYENALLKMKKYLAN